MSLSNAAGVVAVVTVFAAIFAPALAFRLSGLHLPPLPANADQLQEGIEPYPGASVVSSSAVADRYMTGMYSSAGALTAICLTLLVGASGWTSQLLAAVLSLLLLVHSRGMGARWHRIAVMLPGLYGVVLVSLWLGATSPEGSRPLVVGGVLLACAGLTVAALTVPGRRMLPYWGRAADVVHSLLAVTVVPVLLLDLGVYQLLRGLGG